MENKYISLKCLPKLGDASKNLVNQGSWFLYSIIGNDAKYILKIDSAVWLLDEEGNVITCMSQKPQEIILKDSIYFEGIPHPKSLSNFVFA